MFIPLESIVIDQRLIDRIQFIDKKLNSHVARKSICDLLQINIPPSPEQWIKILDMEITKECYSRIVEVIKFYNNQIKAAAKKHTHKHKKARRD